MSQALRKNVQKNQEKCYSYANVNVSIFTQRFRTRGRETAKKRNESRWKFKISTSRLINTFARENKVTQIRNTFTCLCVCMAPTNTMLTMLHELLKAFASGKFPTVLTELTAKKTVFHVRSNYVQRHTYTHTHTGTHSHILSFIAQSIKLISFVNVEITNRIAPHIPW